MSKSEHKQRKTECFQVVIEEIEYEYDLPETLAQHENLYSKKIHLRERVESTNIYGKTCSK